MPPKTKRNKRTLPSPTDSLSSPASPSSPPIRNLAMEESLAKLHAKIDSLTGQLSKIDVLETKIDGLEKTIGTLVHENTVFREEISKRDAVIDQLTEKVNKMDQTLRSTSLRIHGLPINSTTPAAEVPNIVYKEIIEPIFELAKQQGDIPPAHIPSLHFTLVNAFAIPSKKNSPSLPVVVKFHSEFIRSLVFKHKRAALPTIPDPSSNRVRPKFSIYEDLTPSNHSLLRSFADDSRVKTVWSFNGQIRFKTHSDETVYKTTSLSDTFDTLVRPSATPNINRTRNNTQSGIPSLLSDL